MPVSRPEEPSSHHSGAETTPANQVHFQSVDPSVTSVCDWRDCNLPAAYRVSPSAEPTSETRLLCEDHAKLVRTMAEEVQSRRR